MVVKFSYNIKNSKTIISFNYTCVIANGAYNM